MKATAIGYFDAGYAIGYDNTPFQLIAPDSLPGAFLPRNRCFQGINRLGDGISVTIPDRKQTLEAWKSGAFRVFNSEKYRRQFPFGDATEQTLRELFADDRLHYDLDLTLHSCGIVLLEFSADNIDDTIQGADIIRFMQLFEYAAYAYYDARTDFQSRLLATARQVLDRCVPKEQHIRAITHRYAQSEVGPKNVLPSFTLVFFNSRASFLEEVREYCKTHENATDEISVNEKRIICSWYIWGCCAGDDENREMLIGTLKLYTLYYGAAESCEKLLTNLISESMYHKQLTMHQTILLQTIGNIVVNNTGLGVSTQNGEFKAIFARMDASGDLGSFHSAITRSVQVLSDIQQQLQHESDLNCYNEGKSRDYRINKFVVGITAFTFISVIADLFNFNQYSSRLISQTYIRLMIYLAILLALFFVIFKLFDNRPKDRKK